MASLTAEQKHSLKADAHKARGNTLYAQGEYEDAIKEYSAAIIQNSTNAAFYTNRALCYLKIEKFENVLEDCSKAIELNDESVKGYYLSGQARIELGRYDTALTDLEKAYRLSIEQRTFTPNILAALLVARKKRWDKRETLRIQNESQLYQFFKDLAEKHKAEQLEQMKEVAPDDIEALKEDYEQRLNELMTIIEQSNENLKRRAIPDAYLDKISFNVMHDPVITPSGITYERDSIQSHFKKIGYFDPLSRQSCSEKNLIPNLALKEAIDDFLEKNGWAADY